MPIHGKVIDQPNFFLTLFGVMFIWLGSIIYVEGSYYIQILEYDIVHPNKTRETVGRQSRDHKIFKLSTYKLQWFV